MNLCTKYCLGLFLFVSWAGLIAGTPKADHRRLVRLDTGMIRGVRLADGVYAFKGIPYAAPPIGPLRWRPPRPAKPWKGTRECSEFGAACVQPVFRLARNKQPRKMSEDCLYLNVWTTAKAGAKRPVMFWIHGGANRIGSAAKDTFDGSALAQQGVVFVSCNYRLGALGFMAHPALTRESPKQASGNYGLQDQIAALQWVQRNIAAFGGDPNKVTIFGESAGASNCFSLLGSSLADGLFHQVILQSGPYVNQCRETLKEAEARGSDFMQKLGANTLDAMRAIPATTIAQARWDGSAFFTRPLKGGAIIDNYVLKAHPLRRIAAGRVRHIPIVVGSTADEANLFARAVPVRDVNSYRQLLKEYFGDDADKVSDVFPAKTAQDARTAALRLFTVSMFTSPARFVARVHTEAGGKAYIYHFTRVPAKYKWTRLGAAHGFELPYVFATLKTKDRTDLRLTAQINQRWAAFAKSGVPNGQHQPAWPQYGARHHSYLEFGDRVQAEQELYKDACDLFETHHRKALGLAPRAR